jgi:phosphoglycolate phosphatase-like HAD superfamily hydrolase
MTILAFDIDGTIFDCGDIVGDAFAEGARVFGEKYSMDLPVHSGADIMSVVGIPTGEIFRRLYPSVPQSRQGELMDLAQEALSDMVRRGGGILFDGVKPVMKKLYDEGCSIHAASNGTIEYIAAILETHGLMHYFNQPITVLGGSVTSKSDIVRNIIGHASPGKKVIMIGDRYSDLEAARNNGIPFIACAFGHMGESEIEGERWIARRFAEIPGLVGRIVGGE